MRSKCLPVGIAVLVAAGVWQARTVPASGADKERRPDAADLSRRGDYLVNAAILCGDCHTPKDDRGKPDLARHLRGGPVPVRPKKETAKWADMAPDITSRGLGGKWGEAAVVKFLMTGIDPDGKKARPPMPAFRLNALDARAVALYLQSLPRAKAGGQPRQESAKP